MVHLTSDCSLHSLYQIVVMYGEGSGKIIGCAKGNDSQTRLARGVMLHELICNLVDGPVTSCCYEKIIICMHHSICVWMVQ